MWNRLCYDDKDNILESILALLNYNFNGIIEKTIDIHFNIYIYEQYYNTIKYNFIKNLNDKDIELNKEMEIIMFNKNKVESLINSLNNLIICIKSNKDLNLKNTI